MLERHRFSVLMLTWNSFGTTFGWHINTNSLFLLTMLNIVCLRAEFIMLNLSFSDFEQIFVSNMNGV